MVISPAQSRTSQARIGDWAEWRAESAEAGVRAATFRWRVRAATEHEIDAVETVVPEIGVATERSLRLSTYEANPEFRPQTSSHIVSGPMTERKSIVVAGAEVTAYKVELRDGTVVWWAFGIPFGGAVEVQRRSGERQSLVTWGGAD